MTLRDDERLPPSNPRMSLAVSFLSIWIIAATLSTTFKSHDRFLPTVAYSSYLTPPLVSSPTPPTSTAATSSPTVPAPKAKPLTREELQQMVGSDPKYLAKDSHISYGSECTQYSLRHFKHRNEHEEELGAKWNEDGEIWELPITDFLDLPHLRSTYGPVLTLLEFFLLYELDPSFIHPSGHFDPVAYLPPELTIATVSAEEFEDGTFVRVDKEVEEWGLIEKSEAGGEEVRKKLKEAMGGRKVWNLGEAREVLKIAEVVELSEDEGTAERQLKELGMVSLYTYGDEVLMNKAVSRPITEYAPLTSLRPLLPLSSSHQSASILFYQGDLHDQRKPGTLRFSTESARKGFTFDVRQSIRPPRGVWDLALRVVGKIEERVGGRKWLGVHLRRGDFVGINWSEANDPIEHFKLAKETLEYGRGILSNHYPVDKLPLGSD
ncbi:hypothetical protein P7C70_g4899, partial [Phenoliferia sp. Uapishka_3]